MIQDRVGRMRQTAPGAEGDWEGKLEITWDAWSRITSVKNNGTEVGSYGYDGRHRRVTREVDEETLHSYYNDAWRPVEERKNAETTAAVSYLWGSRHRDDLVRRDRAVGGTTLNETRYILMDYFNPAAITDESGEVTERYAFSAFGMRTVLNPDYTMRSSSECGMEFAFQGQFVDGESGLMNYGFRYYSPYLGRWTCKDPIAEKGGLNLYRAFGNDALNHIDHFGLDTILPFAPEPDIREPAPEIPEPAPSPILPPEEGEPMLLHKGWTCILYYKIVDEGGGECPEAKAFRGRTGPEFPDPSEACRQAQAEADSYGGDGTCNPCKLGELLQTERTKNYAKVKTGPGKEWI
jgi:RHS repeat-associated protein